MRQLEVAVRLRTQRRPRVTRVTLASTGQLNREAPKRLRSSAIPAAVGANSRLARLFVSLRLEGRASSLDSHHLLIQCLQAK
eukprot:6173443-Pleurochrysis_carterae.AAC.3